MDFKIREIDEFEMSITGACCLTLLTRVTDSAVPRSRLHCNRKVAPQIERMLFPLGADCRQYIYPHFPAIFIEFDQGKVFLRDF